MCSVRLNVALNEGNHQRRECRVIKQMKVFLEFYKTVTVVCGFECRTLNKKRGNPNESCRNEDIEVDTTIERSGYG